jgi:hypothetical protein
LEGWENKVMEKSSKEGEAHCTTGPAVERHQLLSVIPALRENNASNSRALQQVKAAQPNLQSIEPYHISNKTGRLCVIY